MLKVFLVEDEFVVREGIKNNVNWAENGYEFAGEASDGELAFPMIQKLKPDILITDIRMPFMDGLELSRLVRAELPQTEILILTGYGEFEYAKEAIRIGVSGYLLKPISGAELLAELDKVRERIVERHHEAEIRRKYQKEMEENLLQEKLHLFRDMVSGSRNPAALIERAVELDIDLSALYYNVVLVNLWSVNHAQEEFSGSVIKADEMLQSRETELGAIGFDRGLEGRAVVFKADSEEEIKKRQEKYFEYLRDYVSEHGNIRYFVGIGECVGRLRELPRSFERAGHAYAHRYLTSRSDIVDSCQIKSARADRSGGINLKNIDSRVIGDGRVTEFLKLGNSEEAEVFVEEYFTELGKGALQSVMFRQYIVMNTYFCVCQYLDSLGISKDQVESFEHNPAVLADEEGARRYISDIIAGGARLRENKAGLKYRDVVSEVMDYIDRHYMDEDLSLNMVAGHVNFSPNHLSSVFSQQTGQTFIKYLMDYRMNRAKELLRGSSMKSSMISAEVGYKDPHYFSYLFKKTQGMTPTQYRSMGLQDNEE